MSLILVESTYGICRTISAKCGWTRKVFQFLEAKLSAVRLYHRSWRPMVLLLLSTDMKNDLEKVGNTRDPNFCGSCYGGVEPESGCCNTCESVRQAYLNRGWAFANPDAIEQCMAEHWTDRIKDQMNEGCNLSGRLRIKKVATNLQMSPGRSYQANSLHSHDLVPYLRGDGQTHDFGHKIHHFRIESDDEYNPSKVFVADRIRKRLGVDSNPLDETLRHFSKWKRVCTALKFSTRLITLSH